MIWEKESKEKSKLSVQKFNNKGVEILRKCNTLPDPIEDVDVYKINNIDDFRFFTFIQTQIVKCHNFSRY